MKPYEREFFERECCKPFFFEGNEHGVLLVHGFTGSVAHMRPLGDALREKGYTVKGINLPGHALDEAAMNNTNWQAWLDATLEAIAELRQNCRTVTICGLSMGGLLALLTAQQQLVDACITLSAPMATQNKLIGIAGLLSPVYPRISWSAPEKRHANVNRDYDFGYSGFPTRKAVDLNHLIRMARNGLPSVCCPLLCVQSKQDETIWEESMDCVISRSNSPNSQMLWLTSSPHLCTLSDELPKIVDAVAQILQQVKKNAEPTLSNEKSE